MTTPSPAPQQWADKAADEIFAIHVETGLTGRCEDVAAIITKHAAAISEENQRLRGEIDQLVMERDHFHDERDTLRQWSEQAREAMGEASTAMDALIILGEQNVPAPYAPLKERFARDRLKALFAAHPAQGMEGRG